MKKSLFVLPIVLVLTACGPGTEIEIKATKQQNLQEKIDWRTKKSDQDFVNDIIAYTMNIIYTKDVRTGLCFAWQFRRMSHVPCQEIPSDLLIVVNRNTISSTKTEPVTKTPNYVLPKD